MTAVPEAAAASAGVSYDSLVGSPAGAALPPSLSAQSLDGRPGSAVRGSSSVAQAVAQGEDAGDNIRVYVRVRPPSEREREQNASTPAILNVDKATSSVLLRGEQSRIFTFDGVMDEDATQEEVFDLVGRSIGAQCLAGYNGSVYVYGQTGVGKTYTMSGPVSSARAMQFDARRGLICRILDHVFAEIHRRRTESEGTTYVCRCSFLEIYKEQITDLLDPGNTSLQIREDMNSGVYVERLSVPTVWTLTEAFSLLYRGIQQRHVGSTHMNERSSRSHAVFTLSVEVAHTRAGVTSTRVARLSLVDLAGSERQQGVLDGAPAGSSPSQSLRVREAGAINKSLSALTNVIMSLSRDERSRRRSSMGSTTGESNGGAGGAGGRRPYVHYRDSKLTFLLRDSLGGNSKTVIVANVSPSPLCLAETVSTLKFAARAKHIRCAAVRNEEFTGTVESLMAEVRSLRLRMAELSGPSPQTSPASAAGGLGAGVSSASGVAASAASGAGGLAGAGAGGLGAGAGASSEADLHEEQDVLYSRRRVRRLEVLLAAALERERVADRRRHQLQKLAEFLEDLDFRKTAYMKRLFDDYVACSSDLGEADVSGASFGEDAAELSSKLDDFKQLLGNLAGVPGCAGGLDAALHPVALNAGAFPVAAAEGCGAEEEEAASSPPSVAKSAAVPRKRGTSQALQRGGAAGAQAGTASSDGATAGDTAAGGAVLGGSLTPSSGTSASKTSFQLPGGFVDEASFLRGENRRLRAQLAAHPEAGRLGAENRALRARLAAALAEMGGTCGRSRGGSGPARARKSSLLSRSSGHSSSDEGGRDDNAAKHDDDMGVNAPVSSEMLLRSVDTDDDSTLRTWIYFQKMAKEVEELLRARESFATALENVQLEQQQSDGFDGRASSQRLRLTKGSTVDLHQFIAANGAGTDPQQSLFVRSDAIEPQMVDDLMQAAQDALQLAQSIIDRASADASQPDDESFFGSDMLPVTPDLAFADAGHGLKRAPRLSSSTPTLASSNQAAPSSPSKRGIMSGLGNAFAGFLARNKSSKGLGLPAVGEQDPKCLPTSGDAKGEQADLEQPLSSPRCPPGDEWAQLRHALHKVKHLHGTLDLVNSAYTDAYDRFQCLREEYESRIEECQFFELQCSRLDMHCHELTEMLHGSSHPLRAGIGSFSATGLTSPQTFSMQRRSFSLSSLRDAHFWENRFQELSQLTGIQEDEQQADQSMRSDDVIGAAERPRGEILEQVMSTLRPRQPQQPQQQQPQQQQQQQAPSTYLRFKPLSPIPNQAAPLAGDDGRSGVGAPNAQLLPQQKDYRSVSSNISTSLASSQQSSFTAISTRVGQPMMTSSMSSARLPQEERAIAMQRAIPVRESGGGTSIGGMSRSIPADPYGAVRRVSSAPLLPEMIEMRRQGSSLAAATFAPMHAPVAAPAPAQDDALGTQPVSQSARFTQALASPALGSRNIEVSRPTPAPQAFQPARPRAGTSPSAHARNAGSMRQAANVPSGAPGGAAIAAAVAAAAAAANAVNANVAATAQARQINLAAVTPHVSSQAGALPTSARSRAPHPTAPSLLGRIGARPVDPGDAAGRAGSSGSISARDHAVPTAAVTSGGGSPPPSVGMSAAATAAMSPTTSAASAGSVAGLRPIGSARSTPQQRSQSRGLRPRTQASASAGTSAPASSGLRSAAAPVAYPQYHRYGS